LIPGSGEAGQGAKTTSFLGFQITNLFDFFLVFIVMCGIAAVILFAVSRWLEKKMHGVN
jgi:POT family proton-dependent oligopeptide transporter